jgi:hypothetical protein
VAAQETVVEKLLCQEAPSVLRVAMGAGAGRWSRWVDVDGISERAAPPGRPPRAAAGSADVGHDLIERPFQKWRPPITPSDFSQYGPDKTVLLPATRTLLSKIRMISSFRSPRQRSPPRTGRNSRPTKSYRPGPPMLQNRRQHETVRLARSHSATFCCQ